MQTCKTCKCPLLLLKITPHQHEKRSECTRCFEARMAPKVYRAPKVPATKNAIPTLDDVAAFMNGGKRDEAPTTTLFDRS